MTVGGMTSTFTGTKLALVIRHQPSSDYQHHNIRLSWVLQPHLFPHGCRYLPYFTHLYIEGGREEGRQGDRESSILLCCIPYGDMSDLPVGAGQLDHLGLRKPFSGRFLIAESSCIAKVNIVNEYEPRKLYIHVLLQMMMVPLKNRWAVARFAACGSRDSRLSGTSQIPLRRTSSTSTRR